MGKSVRQLKGTSHRSHIGKLNRIDGQIRGVAKMVEEERYCIDILNQIKAIKAALSTVERSMLNEHLGHCVESVFESKNKSRASEMIAEIQQLLKTSKS